MSDLYRIQTQQTYMGKTAGHYVKTAVLAETQAGDVAIWTPELPGCRLSLTEGGAMVIESFDDAICLRMSDRAAAKLALLTRKADAQMLASCK